MMEHSTQTYSTQLLANFTAVANQNITARKLVDELIEVFEERALLEERYAKSLEKIVGNLNKLEEKPQNTMFKTGIYCLKSMYSSRQHQAEDFATSIKDDLVTTLKQLSTAQNQSSKKLIEDGKKIEKDIYFMNSELKRFHQEYKQKKREYEQNATVMVVYNLLSEYPEKKRIQQYYKVNQIAKEVAELENKYKNSTYDYNNNIQSVKGKLTTLLEQSQQQEESRLIQFKDSLMKQIIFEVSHAKNVQYDLEKITEKLDEIVPNDEIAKFANSTQTQGVQIFEQVQYVQINSFISSSLQKFFQKEFDELLDVINDQQVIQTIKSTFEDPNVKLSEDASQLIQSTERVAKFVDTIWQGQMLIEGSVHEFITKLGEDLLSRKLFILCIEQKRVMQQLELNDIAFDNLAEILNLLLNLCSNNFDAETAKRIMTLSFNFYKLKSEDVRDRIYSIQNLLVSHKIWETRDFWETCIIQSIYEQIKKQQTQKLANQNDQINKEKNMILTILTQLSQNMLLFNFKIEAIKDIMQKFSAFFGLNEEIGNDLLNAIDGFGKAKQLLQQEQEQQQIEQLPKQLNNEKDQEKGKMIDKLSQFFQQLKQE